MTNDNKPRSDKTFVLQEAIRRFPPTTPLTAEVVLGNCTTSIPFKFDFDPKDNEHTMIFAPTRTGMSVDYSALGLTDAEVAKVKITDKY